MSVLRRLWGLIAVAIIWAALLANPPENLALRWFGFIAVGVAFGLIIGSWVGSAGLNRWKKAHPKICTSCGLLLKTYALTSPDGKVHGSYKQCPRWVSTWNSDPVNCHNPPNKKPSVGPWSSYFRPPMPLPPGIFCFVHGAQVNLSCGSCLTYLRSKGVLDEDEVNHLLD